MSMSNDEKAEFWDVHVAVVERRRKTVRSELEEKTDRDHCRDEEAS